MSLGIGLGGIVRRHEDGSTSLFRPGRNGGPAIEIEALPEIADAHRLATGDVVRGDFEPRLPALAWDDEVEDDDDVDLDAQFDEPSAISGIVRAPAPSRRGPSERLTRVTAINGLDLDAAADRPSPRSKRASTERVPPDLRITCARGPGDVTGRMLDFAAPLGAGVFGVVYGPHGGGLTRILQCVLRGALQSAPDCVPIVLLLRPRAEEATDWREQAPEADIVVASAAFSDAPPEHVLQICTLVLEAAQRQTELGRDVVLMVDSLTALWGLMLEAVDADAQHEADISSARQRIREWAQKAGCFHGEGLLGGRLGGSLTIIGSVWHQGIDIEAEEERDTHPHLRLLEHLLPEAAWLVPLSEPLKERRLFPAIDIKQCRSQYEDRLVAPAILEELLRVRGALSRKNPVAAHLRVMEALDASAGTEDLLPELAKRNAEAAAENPEPASIDWLPFFPAE